MIKFFRKHNKRLLVIVTIFLMITFVGGTALSSMLATNPLSQVIGQAFASDIPQGEFNTVKNQTDRLRRLGYNWSEPWGAGGGLPPLDVMDYLLLLREAERQGLKPSLELARLQLAGSGLDLTRFSLESKVSTDRIEEAVANYLMVVQSWGVALQSMMSSELKIQQVVRDQHEKVTANIVEIKSGPLQTTHETTADDVLQAHFDKYREQSLGATPLEFGYLVPDRVQVQYAVIHTPDLKLSQPVMVKSAESYWREHQAEFPRPVDDDIADPEEGPPAIEQPQSPYYQTFAEARDDVFERLENHKRLEEAREMANVLWRALREPWYNQPVDGSGIRQAPQVAQSLEHYATVVESIKDRLQHPANITFGETGLFAESEAADQEGIGGAREDTHNVGRGRRFGSHTHFVEGLVDPAQAGGRSSTDFLSLYQTSPVPLLDDEENLYIYRVIKVDEQHAARSLEEIRDRVLADVQALQAFESAKTHATQLKEEVKDDGLQAAWTAYTGLDAELKSECGSFFESNSFPKLAAELFPGFRFPITISDKDGATDEEGKRLHEIRSDDFVAKVYELLASAGENGIGVIEVPSLETCFVVELTGLERVSISDYETFKAQAQQSADRSRMRALQLDWFLPERIRARVGYRDASELQG